MQQNHIEHTRIFVFKQIEVGGLDYYMHYGCDKEQKLTPQCLLTELEHLALLAYE